MGTWIIRVWLPDRPGALGQVASRVGAVRGDVVGIDILERGAGRAIDEVVVELPDDDVVDLLVHEINQVDGVDVEDIRRAAEALHDPRLDALETAAMLVGAATTAALLEALCVHGARTLGAAWAVVVDADRSSVLAAAGAAPEAAWLAAFVAGSRTPSALSGPPPLRPVERAGGDGAPDRGSLPDIVWAPLPGSGLALVIGRSGTAFRARERRQAAALARIVDTRFRECTAQTPRTLHPAGSSRRPGYG
jgi:hypothetical protein